MIFENSLRRTDLYSVLNFIRNGGESFAEPREQTYADELHDAAEKLREYLKEKHNNEKEFEEVYMKASDFANTYADVYFEMGAILGGKLAFQLQKKMAEFE